MDKIIVVMYHEVSKNVMYPFSNTLCTSADRFEEHLKFYNSNFSIISTRDMNIKTEKTKLLITFDDGYVGNYLYAAPLLRKYNASALFFISTGFIDRSINYWIFIIKNMSSKELVMFLIKHNPIALLIALIKGNKLYRVVKKYFKYSYIKKLNKLYSGSDFDKYFLTWSQVNDLKNDNLFEIGAHTISHPVLSHLKYTEQLYEIKKSIHRLETKLGVRIAHFSYPFGSENDFDEHTKNICRDLGVFAYTTQKGNNSLFDKQGIRRIGIHNDTVLELNKRINKYL
jgi:peptidoglycan/xylan/chitin deacetylase (PgdA/CDA1 family)